MKITNVKSLEKMNFSDFNVLDIVFDKHVKSITFFIDGALYLNPEKRVELGNGYLQVADYNSIKIIAYDAKSDHDWLIDEENFEQLREISEIDVAQDHIVIKGFSKTSSNWLEFNISGGILKGAFLDLTK